jgi:hypothetical protein
MGCSATADVSELNFVLSLNTRSRKVGECRGPVITVPLSSWRVFTLEHAFDSTVAHDVLWSGYEERSASSQMIFALCGAHWLDLSCLLWARAQQSRRGDWHSEADQLLHDVCDHAGWDVKEIINMFAWRHVKLT